MGEPGGPLVVSPPSRCDAARGQDAHPKIPSGRSFPLIAIAFFVIIAGGGLPTPLYVVYEKASGFSSGILTADFAPYADGLQLA